MGEEDIIAKTKKPVTIDRISLDLIKLGVKAGDTLMVHSSLSNIGWVCGGAQSVILALMKVLGKDGTLVMPAHSGDWSNPVNWSKPPVPEDWYQEIYENMPAFETSKTPTRGMGCIAELFRSYPNTFRSDHPQVSFAANGKFAKKIIKGHSLTPQLGMESPLGKMYHLRTKVLLLGVGFNSCTCFHLAESLIKEMPIAQEGAAILKKGKRVWKWFRDYDYDSSDFHLIGRELIGSGRTKEGQVGNANCQLFDMKDGVDFARSWLVKYRFSK